MNAGKPLRLSPSAAGSYMDCGRKYHFQYVERLEADVTDANLVFGSAVDVTIEEIIRGQLSGTSIDAAAFFDQAWQKETRSRVIRYSQRWDEDSMRAMGRSLCQQFLAAWLAAGLMPAIDANGEPLIQREFKLDLGDGVLYVLKPDVIALTRQMRIRVVDFKSAAQPAFEGFAELAPQLLDYQIAVDTHAATLGLDGVDELQFFELVKRPIPKSNRGEGPVIHAGEVVARRSDQRVAERLNELQGIALNIRRGFFPRNPRWAFNSPCSLCTYRARCLDPTSMDGLRVRPPRNYSAAVAPQLPLDAGSAAA